MGLFDRKKEAKPQVEEQESTEEKGSKGLFGGKSKKPKKSKGDKKEKKQKKGKKQKGLIESMGLNEAVASMGISQLEDLVESGDLSAVRSLSDGYTVLVITEEMLQKQGLDVKSADFGSFANAINSEHIQSFLLKNDLEAGVLTIIPDQETLDVLDEFSILEDMIYKWGIIPHDVDDDSTVVQLNNGANLGDLNMIASEAFDLVLQGGKIYTPEQLDEEDILDEDIESDDDEDESVTQDDDLLDDDDEELDVYTDDYGPAEVDFPEDLPEEDFPSDVPDESFGDDEDVFDFNDEEPASIEDESSDLDDILENMDDLDADLSDLDDDSSEDLEDYELQTEEEGRQMITSVLAREFQNDELGVVIPADPFNHQFGDVEPILFNETPNDDSSLARVVAQMRHDANVEILNVHNTHMQALRSHYQNGLADAHDRLVQSLDHKNVKTGFGRKFNTITTNRAEKEELADELISRNKEELNQTYVARRSEFGERAKNEALAKFDDQNKSIHEKEKQALNEEVYSSIQLSYDEEVSNLYDERRSTAKQIFDSVTTKLLLELQKMFADKLQQEHDMYDRFRQSIDAYTRENYSDEVLRAKALATQQRQHHEADDVRAEYESMLTAKQRQLEEAERKAADRVREMENSHSTAVKETVADYKRKVSRQETEIEELKNDQRALQDKLIKLDVDKDAEYANRLKTASDTIDSQRAQLEFEQGRTDKQGKQNIIVLAGILIGGIALGLIMGFLVGTGDTAPTEVAPGPTTQQEGTVSYLQEDTTKLDESVNGLYNTLFADDPTLVG